MLYRAVKKMLENLDKDISNSSLGLHHLLRELGQLYEATIESGKECPELPQVAAELLIDGNTLELMDGDTAHVPMNWITAVLQKVVKLCGDCRIFILSVIGLQSSGKSTLLNKTFGVQFNVSAGRCTRGAFMQLLQIRGGSNDGQYVLVVDTEGLRAPELQFEQAQKHDNELATFVIGLANLTIINIYGSTPGDMDDILQTAIHAFLRMQQVNLKRNCMFVHQNVTAVMADMKESLGHSKLKDKLDCMTRKAAQEEMCEEEYEYFSNVINYDQEGDVFYFPVLWLGDPPMAPVNPRYSKAALQLKAHFLDKVEMYERIKLSDVELRLRDLWTALLHEKFVFSFKNTMEVTVYNSLETKFLEWTMKFRGELHDWEQRNGNLIYNTPADKLKNLTHTLVTIDLPLLTDSIYKRLVKEMNNYFESSDHSCTLEQWRGETNNRLKRLESELKAHAKGHCNGLSSHRLARDEVKQMNVVYQREIVRKVKEFVATLDRRDLEKTKETQQEIDERLKAKFDEQWKEWIQDIETKTTVYKEEVDVCEGVQNSLIANNISEEPTLIRKLQERELKLWGERLELEPKEAYVSLRKKGSSLSKVWKGVRNIVWSKEESNSRSILSNDSYRMHVDLTSDYVFKRAEDTIANQKHGFQNFNPFYVTTLLVELKEHIEEWSSKLPDLVFTKEYYADISLVVAGYAAREFESMVEKCRCENDPIRYLEIQMKPHLFNLFKNQYSQTADEKVAACTLCDMLERSIELEVKKSLGALVLKDIVSLPCFANKSALKAKILIDMGTKVQDSKESGLKDFFLYFTNAKESLKAWIEKYTREYCETPTDNPRLVVLANNKLKNLVKEVRNKISETTTEWKINDGGCVDQGLDTKKWLDTFCSKLKKTLDLTIVSTGFQQISGVEKLKDLDNFTGAVDKGLQSLLSTLEARFNDVTVDVFDTNQPSPCHVIFDNLCGCCEQCPFCKEPCDCTNTGHMQKHYTQQHRPICLGSYRYSKSQEMSVSVCTSKVGSEENFENTQTNWKHVPFKVYHSVYPKWAIPVDRSAESSYYWKWFIGNFCEDVAIYYDAKANEVPSEWKELSWTKAKSELERAFKV